VSRVLNRTRIETLVGRSLAMCVHPYAVWRSRSTRRRVFVFSAYVVGSYALVLGVLQFIASR
jgi:hypothetical protein